VTDPNFSSVLKVLKILGVIKNPFWYTD